MKNKNIILIGMRGSGKTTIAQLLAKKLGRDFFDLDAELVTKAGMTIPEIVERYGWEHFRDKESAIAKEFSQVTNAVIAAGGGVITREENIHALQQHGMFILLRSPVETLLERVGDDPNRPAMKQGKTKKEEMQEVWEERRERYEQAADVIIDTEKKSEEEVVNEIVLLMDLDSRLHGNDK